MCQFLSVLVLRNGDVLHHPMLDSHADLITYFKLPDTSEYIQRFAKVELTPGDWLKPDTWHWKVDENTRPQWLDAVEAQAESATRRIATNMLLVSGEHQLIVDGCWIVGGCAIVRDVRGGRLMCVKGSAQIYNVSGSAQIHEVSGSAQIHKVKGAARIHKVKGAAQVHEVCDSAQIYNVSGSAQIHEVWGAAQIHNVSGSARLDTSAKAHLAQEKEQL